MISALIAEDEAPQRADLRRLLSEVWPELHVVAECEDGLAALAALQAHRPQIAFLDIRMPGLNGIELARAANGVAHVVFTTAYDEHAVQAFEHGAIDYLLKPIRRDRLERALQRLRERLSAETSRHIADLLDAFEQRLTNTAPGKHIEWITATLGASTRLLSIDEVLYFKAEDKYTCVATAMDEAHIRTPLKTLIERLDSQVFWQVHRSVIVRAAAIYSVRRTEEGKLVLKLRGSASELPVSSAFQHRFRGM